MVGVPKSILQKILRLLIWLSGLTIVLTISLAWWQYPEEYHFFKQTISELGSFESASDLNNQILFLRLNEKKLFQ